MKTIVSGTIFLIVLCGVTEGAVAQVVPDSTVGTQVTQTGAVFNINNGMRSGNNLFHSFSQFSIPTGSSAIFNNATDIQNIFSRVTGSQLSNIDGILKTQGSANLFLMNPNGIIFGPNAQLQLGGSFLGTTANAIKFVDGIEFNTVNATGVPLLTVSLPIGLQMGNNPAPITVQGTGYALTTVSSLAPITQNPSASELRVKAGKTLALVGGNLTLTGATLNTPQGRLELGSLSGGGVVSLTPISQGYQLGYESGQRFADIDLTQKSLLTVGALPSSGALNAGSVQLQGKHIKISDGSSVFSKNLGTVAGGEILVQASEGINIVGTTANAQIRSGIRSEGLNTGTGSSIHVITPHLTLSQGAGVNANAFGLAASGDIRIDAGAIEVSGFSAINPTGVTSLTTSSRTAKSAGNLSINSNTLLVSGGGAIASVAFSTGSTGQVSIRNQNTTVIGDNPAGLYSNISAITYGIGTVKNLTLDTNRLQLLNGGSVLTASFLIGQAGNLNVNATESILIDGRSRINNSSINSAVLSPTALIQRVFNLPNILSANAGTVHVTTPTLTLTNGGTISVTNQGTGDGGNINIAANQMVLDSKGSIQAQTASGEGGNITSQVSQLLLLRHNSLISTTSAGKGNGGDINIDSPVIVGLENSDIIANAVKGKGGNIRINTQSIFGLKYRDRLTAENDITASSQFGINGNVQINTIGINPANALNILPVDVVDSSRQIADRCGAARTSSFVATGRGGIPQGPRKRHGTDRPWNDLRPLTATSSTLIQPIASAQPLIEASAIQVDETGAIALVAAKPIGIQAAATCGMGDGAIVPEHSR